MTERIAMYLRLSKEDEYCRDESNSISTQRALIHDFIRNRDDLRGLEVLELKDDGYSGKNMNRPAMQELLELIRKRQVSCLIVKDFSRFSRDYLVLGQYTEQIFPFMGIRFIAINDGYDSSTAHGGIGEIDVAFKGLLYDYYSEDLSQKVRTSIRAKKETGKYMNAFAPYGYQMSAIGPRTLTIEPEGAAVIRRIFELYADGMSMYAITKQLNADSVLCPQEYICQRDEREYFHREHPQYCWNTAGVSRILHDRVYLGDVVYNKYRSPETAAKHSVALPETDWKVKTGMHEAIIDRDLWNRVQERLIPGKRSCCHEKHVLSGMVVCGGCGHKLQHSWQGCPKYVCYHRHYDPEASGQCIVSIRDEELETVILKMIQKKITAQIRMQEAQQVLEAKHQNQKRKDAAKQKALEKSLELQEAELFQDYREYKDGKLSRENYLKKKVQAEKKSARIQAELEQQKIMIQADDSAETPENWTEQNGFLNVTALDRTLLETMIRQITVYADHRIEIEWNMKEK